MCVSKTVEILSFCHFLCQKESIAFQRFWSKVIYPTSAYLFHPFPQTNTSTHLPNEPYALIMCLR